MITDVLSPRGARAAHARDRLRAGMPPLRGPAELRPGDSGPCVFRTPDRRLWTLWVGDARGGMSPAPELPPR